MHRSRRSPAALPVLLVLVLATALALPPRAAAETVRVFLVGHKQRVADAETVASFRAKMLALVDARLRTPDLVQAGVDDVASHLPPHDPSAPPLAVVHFPEATGLVAGLIGSRGATARAASTATEAFASLLGPYGEQIAYYSGVYPELQAQPIRALILALTDVLYRSVYETFREIAMRYGVWVSVSFDAAPARRVEASEAPDLVALLRDPDEPERSYAYVATSPLPRNFVFLFAPDGELVVPDGRGGTLRAPSETGGELSGVPKVYLTPIEQTIDKPGGGLSLASASLRDLDVLDTPVGAIGVVISKDAWMPDVNERFDLKGASFLLQSEAFSTWAYDTREWAPDVFKSGGYANLQIRGGFLYNVAPSLTGNLFDTTFDGQSAILVRRRDKTPAGPRTPDNGFIGQLADRGFLRLAPWIVPDPDPSSTARTLAERREELAAAGAPLLPGSGVPCPSPLAVGSCENGYREAVVWADLDIPPGPSAGLGVPVEPDPTRRPTSFGVNRAVSPHPDGRQRRPRVAARGRTVAVVWDDTRDGALPQIYLALSRDGGDSFAPAIKVSDAAPGVRSELDPDVAIGADGVYVVWQAFERGADDDAARIELARFALDGTKVVGDVRVDGGDKPAGRWQPAIALLGDGAPVVAWIDERDTGPDGVALAHVYAARGTPGGASFAPAVRVDRGEPTPLAASLDNKWAPAILAVGQTVHVAWVDFRDYNWDVYVARSTDGGRSFGENQRVNGYPDFERICDAPSLARARSNAIRVAWTDIRAREPDTNVFVAESPDNGATWRTDRQLDRSWQGFDPNRVRPSYQSHVALARAGERGFAVWQDDRRGNSDILFAALDDESGGTAQREQRVDDTGDGPSYQGKPHLAVVGHGDAARCVVVWEDDREGLMRIYTASRRCTAATRTLPELAG
ncbi:MAG TPA: hypothetical protein VIS07_20570 [Candidatus Binatia bacterium]